MTATGEQLDSSTAVLAFARDNRVAADRAEANVLVAAATWGEQNPPESIHEAATWSTRGGDCPLPLAGEGAPLVAEFCIAEFAAAIGRSTDAGRAKIAHALELKYRLPRHWARVRDGSLESWRACRVAAATIGLSHEAAAFMDAQLAGVAHQVGVTRLERLVEVAIARFMPDLAEENAHKAAEDRHVSFFHQQVSLWGTTGLQAELDLADALDLDAAITAEAEALRLAGCTESLDVRRAIAAGRIARRHLGLDPRPAPDPATHSDPGKSRQVILYVHLSDAALTGTTHGEVALAEVENHRRTVLAAQVRTWCAAPDAHVIVKPVIDIDEHLRVQPYDVPDRLREQTILRDKSCVFPWCTRDRPAPATSTTSSRTSKAAKPPATTSHPCADDTTASRPTAPWTYTVIVPGTYLWSSPHGYQFLRDHHGTLDVTSDRPPPRSADPPHF